MGYNSIAAKQGRYLGTVRSMAFGQSEDSKIRRMLWNLNHRVTRLLERREPTTSWIYSSPSFRQANASIANQVEVVLGLMFDSVKANVWGLCAQAAGTEANLSVGVGVDSTTTNSAQIHGDNVVNGHTTSLSAIYWSYLLGFHYLVWLEYGSGTLTNTWYGNAGNQTAVEKGMLGEVIA